MQQTSIKGVQDWARLGKKGDSLGIVQETEIWPSYHMLHAEIRISAEMRKILKDTEMQTDYLIPVGRQDFAFINNNNNNNNNKKTKNKNLLSIGFCRFSGPQYENKRKQKVRQVLRPFQRTKRSVGQDGYGNTNGSWCTWNSL